MRGRGRGDRGFAVRGAAGAQPAAWSPQPWLEDLAVAREAFRSKYANLEWLLTEREFDVDALFARADGSSDVRGVIPDLLLPWRSSDGAAFRARMLEAALPDAIRRARAVHRRR